MRALAASTLLLCCLSLAAAAPSDAPPSNYQGRFACDSGVTVFQPASLDELPSLVASASSVRATGFGGSWASGFFCPSASASPGALSVVMTETEGVRAARSEALATFTGPLPIQIDEQAQTVAVEAGVPVGTLLNHLSNARQGVSVSGWVLPTYPSGADITMAGIIATGSHSSSTSQGSQSAQVLGITAVLANGSVATFSEAASPHLFRAMKVSVGRLGIITGITAKIKPQGYVRKVETSHSVDSFSALLQSAATAYAAARQAGDSGGQAAALVSLDSMWAAWPVAGDTITATQYAPAAAGEADVIQERDAFPRSSVTAADRFDGYEVAVPLEAAAGCLEGMHSMIRSAGLANGFGKDVSIRFVNEEDGYLAYTLGGPRMFLSIDDFTTPNGQPNSKLHDVLRFLRQSCQGRLHWGKAGWGAELDLGSSGAASFGAAWCNFGCAAQQLDPTGKFAGSSSIWSWSATRGGAAVDFASCCTDAGFDAACQCL